MNKGFQVAVVKVFFPRRQLKVGCPETAHCEDMFTSAPNQTFKLKASTEHQQVSVHIIILFDVFAIEGFYHNLYRREMQT